MIPSHHDYGNARELAPHSCEMRKGVHDGRIHRPHRMKDVATDHHQIRCEPDNAVNRALEAAFDVRLTLIHTALSKAVILAETDVKIGKMDESHVPNLFEGI